MVWSLNKKQQIKLSLSIYVLIVTFSVIGNYQNCDAFFPRSILSFVDLIYFGHMPTSTLIGYSSFGAIICLALGFSPESLLVIPISIIPLSVIGYVLLYRLSKNTLLSTVLVGCLYCIPYAPSLVLYWSHTVGNILYLTIILLFIIWVNNRRNNKSCETVIFLCISILLISLNYISYNMTAMAVLNIFSLVVIVLFVWMRDKYYNLHKTHDISSSQLIVLSIISCAMIMSLNSFYYTFMHFIDFMGESGVSYLDKFLLLASRIFEGNDITYISPLTPYYLSDIEGIPFIGALRYIIIGLGILIYGYWLLKMSLGKYGAIQPIDIILSSVLFGTVVYILIRILLVGDIGSFSLITLPAILILVRMTTLKYKPKLKKIGVVLVVIFVVLLLIQVSSISISKIDEPKNLESYPQISEFGSWAYLYSTKYTSSDVFTYGSICLSSVVDNNPILFESISPKYSVFVNNDEILSILGADVPSSDRTIIINWLLPQISVSTTDWVTLNPWKIYEDEIKYNPNYNVVWSSGFIACLSPLI
ncbi:hypothetical protein SDC9_41141 [bioreactor metagenome]|uniref:Glycosyltransferase RgtA/B/C/D-like domain-containing protein n=1 Tax=bioreactor metagenome TaxID=1076179 RepID=A0A644VUD8_9ZZZZ